MISVKKRDAVDNGCDHKNEAEEGSKPEEFFSRLLSGCRSHIALVRPLEHPVNCVDG